MSVDGVPSGGGGNIQERKVRGDGVPQKKHVPQKAGGNKRDKTHSGARRLDKAMFCRSFPWGSVIILVFSVSDFGFETGKSKVATDFYSIKYKEAI